MAKGGGLCPPLPSPMCVYVFHDLRSWVIFCIFAAMKHEESKLQKHCVMFFRKAYPQYAGVFFAVPNGGSRNAIEASRLKAEGVLAGVADLLLLVPNGQYNCLAIEMKTGKGRQSERQKEFETALTSNGGNYVVCRSFDDFKNEICKYLNYSNLK